MAERIELNGKNYELTTANEEQLLQISREINGPCNLCALNNSKGCSSHLTNPCLFEENSFWQELKP